jgi:5'(3')-deoxyribonucleotidase
MTKPRLICDVDGVLADYHGAVINVLNAHGFAYSRRDMKSFDHAAWMCDEAFRLFESIVMDPNTGYEFYRDLELLPRAHRLLPGGDLYERFNIIYVTASNKTPEWIKARFQWFVEHGVNPARQVVFCATAEKEHITGEYMIDDHLPTVVEWSTRGGIGLLIDAPWNRGAATDCYRLNSTSEACAFLDVQTKWPKSA